MHEATFELKDCGPFLLLNMVAIGSLFIGTTDAVDKVRCADIDHEYRGLITRRRGNFCGV